MILTVALPKLETVADGLIIAFNDVLTNLVGSFESVGSEVFIEENLLLTYPAKGKPPEALPDQTDSETPSPQKIFLIE